MKIVFSIIINAIILFLINYLLAWNEKLGLENAVVLWCWDCAINSILAWKIYAIGGIILWIINYFIKPLLKILSLPLFFLFLWLASFLINWIILYIFDFIMNNLLIAEWIGYKINWTFNFIIAIAIFTILNILYSLIPNKK